jgi:hypothetical protein
MPLARLGDAINVTDGARARYNEGGFPAPTARYDPVGDVTAILTRHGR